MEWNSKINSRTDAIKYSIVIAVIMGIVLFPFLGLSDFNTKGEPREAVVSYTMLETGNWILPVNNGGDIPYKPPFFHWCVAGASALNGGVVNEYASRLPSAVALICMCVGVFVYYGRRRSILIGALTAGITFTAFEIYRAGMNCRVDMMLTALTVLAIYFLSCIWEKKKWWYGIGAILLMSAAVLTKGPVGIIIPCLCVGMFLLMRGKNFWKVFFSLFGLGILSLILPMVWYVLAYQQGGDEFLQLVMEENFGRMMGTMTYESHVNPWYYNVLTLLAGFIPWTLACVSVLFIVNWRGYKNGEGNWVMTHIKGLWGRFLGCEWSTGLSIVSAITIFLFYCIPASKRSVYLMPMYPFTALFIAEMLEYMVRKREGALKWLGDFVGSLIIAMVVVLVVIKLGLIHDSIFGRGRHAAQNIAIMRGIEGIDGFFEWFWICISMLIAGWWFLSGRRIGIRKIGCGSRSLLPLRIVIVVIGAYIGLSGSYLPAIARSKSLKPMSHELIERYEGIENNIYEYISGAEEAKGNPLHYFELNFYLGNKVKSFSKENPGMGYLLIGNDDAESVLPIFEQQGYRFEKVYTPAQGLPRHTPELYKFER